MSTATMNVAAAHVVPHAEWLRARNEFLAREKEFTRLRDELSRQRRELPWELVEKDYRFDGVSGQEKLADLFDGRGQLIIYHFMLAPEWVEGCRGCSFISDQFDAMTIHLAHRDTTLVAVSHAPIQVIENFRKRMGWKFHWVSSFRSSFNYDFGVTFTPEQVKAKNMEYNYGAAQNAMEELPGLSVFARGEEGQVYHTYSTYARGLDILLGTYNMLDLTPKGRDEDGLAHPFAWLRHHDKYEQAYFVDAKAGYEAPAKAPQAAQSSCCSGNH